MNDCRAKLQPDHCLRVHRCGKARETFFCDQFTAETVVDRPFELNLWNFGVLGIPEVRNTAASTAAIADMMILSMSGTAPLGVKIKMVTGDALAIARETAKKLDTGADILDAASLGDSKKEETPAVAESIEKADGFAQVSPEHKFHLIDVLQKRGHIVGMTGGGVNDAPALKKADCGLAVSGATDAVRAAAAIVLLTPGLSVSFERIFNRLQTVHSVRENNDHGKLVTRIREFQQLHPVGLQHTWNRRSRSSLALEAFAWASLRRAPSRCGSSRTFQPRCL